MILIEEKMTVDKPILDVCTLFEENHKSYINPPKRCQELFNAAFRMPDGTALVIVEKEA